jgi:hypothetical protein
VIAAFDAEYEPDHIGADVEFIANEFDIDVIMSKTGTDQTDIAVMERGHLVAEMAEVAQTMVVSIKELFISSGTVDTGGSDAFSKEFCGEFCSAGHFDSVRDLEDGEDIVEAFDFCDIRSADKVRVLSAEAFRVDVRTFQVNTGDLTAFDTGVDVFGSRFERGCEGFFGESQSCGEKSCDPFFEFINAHSGRSFESSVAEIESGSAMAVNVDKTGHSHIALEVDDLIGIGESITGSVDTADAFSVDKDCSGIEICIRRDETAIFKESCHFISFR